MACSSTRYILAQRTLPVQSILPRCSVQDKGPKKQRKRRFKATEVLSDESGDDLDGESSWGVEVMNSIDS
jgi:hypothetical protein